MRYLVDTRTFTVGRLVGRGGSGLLLKPLGGGPEWCCPPGYARQPTMAERLHAGVAAANARSSTERAI